MITLHGHGPAFGLPDANPDAMIAAGILALAALPFRVEAADAARTNATGGDERLDTDDLLASSAGSIGAVALLDGDLRIEGVVAIRGHAERRTGTDLDAGLSARDRAVAAIVARMLAEDLLPAVVHLRDEDADTAVGADRRPAAGDHTDDLLARGERALAALSELIGAQRYLMGDHPTAVDAAACAALAHAAAPGTPGAGIAVTRLRLRIEASSTLSRYLARTMRRFHPAHPWAEGRPQMRTFPCDLVFSSPAVERAVALMAHL